MNWLKEKNDFKRRLHELIAEFERQAGGAAPPDYLGARHANPLEHVTRRHLIDHILIALGWDLSQMNREVIEEARVRGRSTLFLDYLGVNPETRVPLVIVEAKAWGKPFVAASGAGAEGQGERNTSSPAALLAAAIQHLRNGGGLKDSPVTLEWAKWLATLRDYIGNVQARSGHIVSRVAISSGQWLVVFTDPGTIFLKSGDIPLEAIRVFAGSGIVEGADDIFDLLARSVVIDDVPALLRPSRLPAFTSPWDVARLFRALWVTRAAQGPYFQLHPQLILNVALVLERRDGALLTVIDEQLPHQPVPHDYATLSGHIEEVRRLSDRLLELTRGELRIGLVPSPIKDFPGFDRGGAGRASELPRPAAEGVKLLKPWRSGPDQFLLVLGADAHFLRSGPEVVSCGFHEWAVCHAQQQSQGASPIVTRSVNPAAFFYTGELHHCAHRTVHDRRDTRCQINAFEQFLCCRACTLQPFCWDSADLARLPCGMISAREGIEVETSAADAAGAAA